VGLWLSGRCRTVTSAQLYAILFLISTFFIVLALDGVVGDQILGTNRPFLSSLITPFMVLVFSQQVRAQEYFYMRWAWLLAGTGQFVLAWRLLGWCESRVGGAQDAP